MPDAMTPYLEALKTEITTDPKSLGYEGKTNQEIADIVNTAGLSDDKVNVGVIESYRVVKVLVATEVEGLSEAQRQTLGFIISAGQVDASDTKIQALFLGMFGSGTATRVNLIALAKRSASRTEIKGFPITVRRWHVGRARAL